MQMPASTNLSRPGSVGRWGGLPTSGPGVGTPGRSTQGGRMRRTRGKRWQRRAWKAVVVGAVLTIIASSAAGAADDGDAARDATTAAPESLSPRFPRRAAQRVSSRRGPRAARCPGAERRRGPDDVGPRQRRLRMKNDRLVESARLPVLVTAPNARAALRVCPFRSARTTAMARVSATGETSATPPLSRY